MAAVGSDALAERCRRALGRLWGPVYGQHGNTAQALTRAEDVITRGVSTPPEGWRSLVSDDHTPVEFSIAFQRGDPQLRFLFEAQGDEPTVGAQEKAARALDGWLESDHGAHLERLRSVAELFTTADGAPDVAGAGPEFALWHGAIFAPDGRARFKAYLDPYARGRARAADVIERSLERLGNPGAWDAVARLAERGPALDPIRFFSLDLFDHGEARIKIYVAKHDVSLAELERGAALARHHDREALCRFLDVAAGGHDGYFTSVCPLVTCFDFVGGDPVPRHFTLHFPIRAYAGHDGEARDRITRVLDTFGHRTQVFEEAVDAFAERPLDKGSGLFAYVSFRAEPEVPCVTAYLSSEARHVMEPHPTVEVAAQAPVRGTELMPIIRRYEEEPITWHPFLQRLAREPLAMEHLCLVLLNFREGITRHFTRRLAQIVARVDEEALRSILAKQLNDELGDGDPGQAHRLLFERFVDGMEAYRPASLGDAELAPGRTLGETLEDVYCHRDAYEGVGATLMMEIFGRQVDQFLGDQFRRQSELPDAVLEWLNLHEELESSHVDEVFELARHVPEGDKTVAALRGVQRLATAGWAFFDRMYRVVWPR